jgi:FKBP-type peptidyl-prolyl cis-trans isomerase
MGKQTVFLIIAFLLFFSAVSGGYYVFFIREKEDGSLGKYSNINNEEEQLKPTEQVDDQQPSGLQVQGASTDSSKNPNSLPVPKQFSVYEEHANDAVASYIDIIKGQGATAEEGDNLAVVYKGWFTNGELFDQSRKNEQGQIEPFVLQLGAGKVIPGWEQTLKGMKVGGKRRLIIPYSVGYGEAGQGPIPAKAMLIFDVELVEVQKQDLNPSGAILP